MVFIGVFGTLSVGKSLFIDYCIRNYEFSLINLTLEDESIKRDLGKEGILNNSFNYQQMDKLLKKNFI